MQMSDYVLDSFFAPELSKLNNASPPEVDELPNLMASLALNQVFVVRMYDQHQAPLVSGFVTHLTTAAQEYRLGRERLLKFIGVLPEHSELSSHRRAVAHFESCILHGYVSIVCLTRLGSLFGVPVPPLFTHGDGSIYDRLRLLNNRIKHFDEDVAKAAKAPGKAVPLAPIWLTNIGLESTKTSLTFAELAEILKDQSTDATSLAETMFREFVERRKAKKG